MRDRKERYLMIIQSIFTHHPYILLHALCHSLNHILLKKLQYFLFVKFRPQHLFPHDEALHEALKDRQQSCLKKMAYFKLKALLIILQML